MKQRFFARVHLTRSMNSNIKVRIRLKLSCNNNQQPQEKEMAYMLNTVSNAIKIHVLSGNPASCLSVGLSDFWLSLLIRKWCAGTIYGIFQ